MKRLFMFLLALPLLVACSDREPENSLDNYLMDIATIENPEEASSFFLTLDDSTRLWTIASNLRYYRPKDGQRVIASYSIINEKPDSLNYNYDIRLNDVYEILTKGIFNLTPETADSIGNDYIFIEDIWIGSHFLNVEFIYPGNATKHFINLVSDSTKTYNDNKVHLEFRHNANGDYPAYNRWGIVSFNLKSLEKPGQNSVDIVVHTNEFNSNGNDKYEFKYIYNSETQLTSKRVFNIHPNRAVIN